MSGHSTDADRPVHAALVLRHELLGLKTSLCFFCFAHLFRKFDPDQPRDERGRWTETGAGEDDDVTTGTVLQRGRTGNRFIDSYTEIFEGKIEKVLNAVGPGSGPAYGQQVHQRFCQEVGQAGLRGIRVERGWLEGVPVVGSLLGSIRTDVVLHENADGTGAAVAVWDLKTSSATLAPPRLDQIRRQVGVGPEVPVIELHVLDGTTVKSQVREAA